MKKVFSIVIIVCLFLNVAAYAAWSEPEIVDEDGNVGQWANLALDDDDDPHIAYYSDNESIKYAFWEDDRWVIESNPAWAENPTGNISMDLDQDGLPHMIFRYGDVDDELYYTFRHTAGNWEDPVFISSETDSSSIAVDRDIQAYVAYHHIAQDKGMAYGSSYDPAPWTQEEIEYNLDEWDTGIGPSIVISDNGTLFVSYVEHSNVRCKRKHRDDHGGGVWEDLGGGFPDDSGDDKGNVTDIALSEDDVQPHIVYTNSNSGYVRYAIYNGNSWHSEDVGENGGSEFVSIDVQDLNKPHIAFYDKNERCLKYARKNRNDEWRVETVDEYSGGHTPGKYPSIKLDSKGDPHIAYYDHSMGHLKYTYWEDDDDDDEPVPDLKKDDEVIIGNNKFNPRDGDECRIMYDISHDQEITIKVYNLRGQLVKTIIENEMKDEGAHGEDTWDGLDSRDYDVPSGIYYIVIESNADWKKVKKVAIVKGE
ncbi:hypothetical protein ACFLUV_00330 [Elusimicrobiota bacterium]